MAQKLGPHHAILRLPAGGPAHHLHDQRHRVREHEFAQDHEEPWSIPQRRGVAEIVLFGAEQHSQEVDDAGAKLEARAEPVYHSIWGKDAVELTLAPFTQNSGHPRQSVGSTRYVSGRNSEVNSIA